MGGETMTQAVRAAKFFMYWVAPTAIATVLSGFIIISSLVGFFPETFGPIFGSMINYHETGLYADCSLSSNRQSNSLCTGKRRTQEDREWDSIRRSKKPVPFSLHGN